MYQVIKYVRWVVGYINDVWWVRMMFGEQENKKSRENRNRYSAQLFLRDLCGEDFT
jgi:hypothetical protein